MASSPRSEEVSSSFLTTRLVQEMSTRPRKLLKEDDVLDILNELSVAQIVLAKKNPRRGMGRGHRHVGHDLAVDSASLRRAINEAVRKSNFARAILLPSESIHESIGELGQISGALDKARRAINPVGKQQHEYYGLHHFMALEFDRLADQNAREPVTLSRSQGVAISACGASFPDFYDDNVLRKIFGAVPHTLLLSRASDEAKEQVKRALDGLDLLARLLEQHMATLQRRQQALGTKDRPRNADQPHARPPASFP